MGKFGVFNELNLNFFHFFEESLENWFLLSKTGKFRVSIEESALPKRQIKQISRPTDCHQDYIFYCMH